MRLLPSLLALVTALSACGAGSTATGPVSPPGAIADQGAPTRTPTRAERTIAHAGMAAFATDDEGDLLTVWSTCAGGGGKYHCDYAWRLDTGRRTYTGMLPRDSGPQVTVGPGGFVVKGWDSPGIVVAPDGSVAPLRPIAPHVLVPGDVLVPSRDGVMAAEPKTGTRWPLSGSTDAGFATGTIAGETAWTQELYSGEGAGATVAWSHDGRTWQRHRISGHGTVAGTIAAVGDRVAASAGTVGDDVQPLAVWSVSTDAGRTWTDLPAADLPFFNVDEMAATPGGTLYVHSLQSGLFRSTDGTWTHFAKVGTAPVSGLRQVAGGVGMLQWRHGRPREIVVYDDAGHVRPLR